jgi:hypothetical protein
MRAPKYSPAAVSDLLLNRGDLDINVQNQAQESALWYAIHYGTFSAVNSIPFSSRIEVNMSSSASALAIGFGGNMVLGLKLLVCSKGIVASNHFG